MSPIRITTSLLLIVCISSCARERDTPSRYLREGTTAGTVSGVVTISDLPNGEWHLPAGDHANTRFSPLAQITTGNVSRLRMISAFATGIPRGHEGQPLIVGRTLYMVTPYPNLLYAFDLAQLNGPVKWVYDPRADARAVGIACCDVVNRGASYADGKVIYAALDAHVIAVDAETGKEAWRTKVGNVEIGETITMAPVVVKNRVIVGNSGGELGVRGVVVALDLASGAEVWRAYHTGPDSDVLIGADFKPYYPSAQGRDLGVSTWPTDTWKLGGGTVWGWISYDPALDLIYYGTGNPAPWNPDLRRGDNK